MMDLAASLVFSNNLRFEEGEIRLFGTGVCLIPPTVYLSLYRELERTGQERVLYETSKESASFWFTNLAKSYGKLNADELLDFLPKILNLLGYGILTIKKRDLPNCYFELSLDSPLFPELYGPSKKPVDLLFAGLLAGSISAILKRDMLCVEKECAVQGLQTCFFIVKCGDN